MLRQWAGWLGTILRFTKSSDSCWPLRSLSEELEAGIVGEQPGIGMGEPMANYDSLMKALDTTAIGMSHRGQKNYLDHGSPKSSSLPVSRINTGAFPFWSDRRGGWSFLSIASILLCAGCRRVSGPRQDDALNTF